MPVVMVHGNPETDAVWRPLVAELGLPEVIRLSPPGWGAATPDGWTATVEEYRRWLVGELEEIGEPVDLVGHDWGGGHALNVAMTRPDLLRTWVSDLLGCFDPEYVWHPLAQRWQHEGCVAPALPDEKAQPRTLERLVEPELDRLRIAISRGLQHTKLEVAQRECAACSIVPVGTRELIEALGQVDG